MCIAINQSEAEIEENMKRSFTFLIIFFTVLIGIFSLSGCGSSDKSGGAKENTSRPKLKIVANIFPEYSWTKE